MKRPDISDLLRRLPSSADLLEKPQIKHLMDRLNPREVATGVSQFVDRMRREVSRRALDLPLPSIGDLADRAAKFILRRNDDSFPEVVNASGQLWGSKLTGPPLADDAIQAMSGAGQHFRVARGNAKCPLAAELAGADEALAVANPIAALLLTMSSVANGSSIAIARGELGMLDATTRLTDLAAQVGVCLLEIGATDQVELRDYEQALDSGANAIVRIESLPYALDAGMQRPSIGDLGSLVSRRNACLLHHIGRGSLTPLAESIPLKVINAKASLQAGSRLVVARGDGYIGGPPCGLVVGQRELVDQVATHPLASTLSASELSLFGLEATLALHRRPDEAALAIPTLALLSTPLENLRTRAERLAPQIAASSHVAEAHPREIAAATDLGGMQPLPSYGIAVTPNTGDAVSLRQQIAEGDPPVEARLENEQLLLDLRTVFPADDIRLVAAFEEPLTEVQED